MGSQDGEWKIKGGDWEQESQNIACDLIYMTHNVRRKWTCKQACTKASEIKNVSKTKS